MRKFIGYHGTKRKSANMIIQSGKIIPSTKVNEWLGCGVYFFEDDCMQAYNFAKKARKYDDVVVIRSEIEAEKVFDLVQTKYMNIFRAVYDKINERINDGDFGNLKVGYNNGIIIEYICRYAKFDVVRHAFQVPATNKLRNTNIMPIQIQLCVRNEKCIKNTKEVVCDE